MIVKHAPDMPPLNRSKRFDVRSLIARGVEPYAEIRKRVGAINRGEGLIIVAPFLTSPLIEKLGSEGSASRLERGSSGEWMVYIWCDSTG